MNARFEQRGPNKVEMVVTPDYGIEALLMSVFLGYDENVISVDVERHDNGQIKAVTFTASDAR